MSYIEYPLPFGINLVTQESADNLYSIPRSQTAVFPFKLGDWAAVRVDAGHSSFYDNQNGTLSAWASNEINGRSITTVPNSLMSRVNLMGLGFSWMFHRLDANTDQYKAADLKQWIDPDKTYYMCIQNLENADNGLFLKFTYYT